MKRQELRKLLNDLVDVGTGVPFNEEDRKKALAILSTPGVCAELRTILWEVERNDQGKS